MKPHSPAMSYRLLKEVIQLFAVVSLMFNVTARASEKTMIDYFLPMPIHGALTMNAWGAPGVIPRDPLNGLEDPTLKNWYYWDGKIIKGPDGKYHLFASR